MGKRKILLRVLSLVLTLVSCGTRKAVVTESDSSFVIKERIVMMRDSVRWIDSTYYDTLHDTWHHERIIEKYLFRDVAKMDSTHNNQTRQPIILYRDKNSNYDWFFVCFFVVLVVFLFPVRSIYFFSLSRARALSFLFSWSLVSLDLYLSISLPLLPI